MKLKFEEKKSLGKKKHKMTTQNFLAHDVYKSSSLQNKKIPYVQFNWIFFLSASNVCLRREEKRREGEHPKIINQISYLSEAT